ncbi:A/G-specific adenine glycosylase [Gaopeijia maritima]|uniref:Adenine DNA glycosylase n=1 Tax=Gaopeijia maritima TaxID=3119007 RepID=A0ABU9E8B2_9BACT
MPGLRSSDAALGAFRRALLAFYDDVARPLPWRDTRDPYAIWVSEVMAQQTRVETVVPYYLRWLERYPTVEALADAPLDDVLKSWEGLGYYSRARNLHRAAGVVAEDHGGALPDSFEGLRALPGVGEYTAGAIASIAFERAVPAVDGNVRRVYARLADEPRPGTAEVRDWAERVVDPARPGDFNQALMELGATVCTPRNPACGGCPVRAHCRALAAGTVEERPAPKKRARVRKELRAVGVFVRSADGKAPADAPVALLRRRPAEGLLAGLWEFPSVPLGLRAADRAVQAGVRELAADLGLTAVDGPGERLDPVPHQFSHLHVIYRPWMVAVEGDVGAGVGGTASDEPVRWTPLHDPGDLALPVAQQRIAALAVARRPSSRSFE